MSDLKITHQSVHDYIAAKKRDDLLDAAASAMRRGIELNADGAPESHPDFAKVMPAQHAAAAAGISPSEIWQAATAPQ